MRDDRGGTAGQRRGRLETRAGTRVSATLDVVTTDPTLNSGSDQALRYALRQLRWYRRARSRARFFHQAGELTILLTTAATVVVAALRASAIVTAAIAAVALFLTGFRQVFGPGENWVRTSRAWVDIEHAILRYQLIPEIDRGASAQQALMEEVIAISARENVEWALLQRNRAVGEPPHDHSLSPPATDVP